MSSRSTIRRTTLYSTRRLITRPTCVVSSQTRYQPHISTRGYAAAGLKELKTRIATVQSIVKVTSSMKMIANAKLAKQQERLREGRVFTNATFQIMDSLYPQLDHKDEFYPDKKANQDSEPTENEVIVTIASDRGLCGGVNSNIGREAIRLLKLKTTGNVQLVMIGEKTLQQLLREWSKNFTLAVSGVSGNKPVTFHEVLLIADKIMGLPYSKLTLLYSRFHNMVSFQVTNVVLPGIGTIVEADSRNVPYQWSDDHILKSTYQYSLATLLFGVMTESQTCEIAARMSAMENASNNGRDIIKALSLAYNKQRQTSITTELVEIVSGATAQDEAKKEEQ